MNSMTNNKTGEKIPMEALCLVPWYATGSLSEDELVYLEEQIKIHPALKEYIAEEQEVIHLIEEDKSLLELSALESTSVRLEKVLEKMEGIPQESTIDFSADSSITDNSPKNHHQPVKSFGDKIRDMTHSLLFGNSERFKYAGLASVTVFLALLVAFIAPLINTKPETVFHPASEKSTEPGKSITSTQLLVGIQGNTQNPWLIDFLKKNGASLSKVPSKDGLYHISLNRKLDENETNSLLGLLKNQKELIWFAGEAY